MGTLALAADERVANLKFKRTLLARLPPQPNYATRG
jgi:hypothetical protein